jgi:hypothetical protein
VRFVPLLLAAACLPTVEVEQPERCDALDGGVSTPSGRAALLGAPITVISSRRSPLCPPSLALDVTTTVTDPLLRVIESELKGPFARGQFVSAEVSFTPVTPGLHRVEVSFAQLGRATNEVLAVQAATLGPRLGTLDTSIDCQAEDVTASGAWICLERTGSSSTASFWRRGQQLQAVPAAQVQVIGNVVWLFRLGQLERFVDSGGSVLARDPNSILILDGELAEADSFTPVDGSSFFAAKGSELTLVTIRDDRLERSTTVGVPRGLCPASARVMPESTSTVAITCGSRPGYVRFCRVPVATPSDTACTEVEGQLTGASREGMWTTLDRTLAFTSLDAGVSLELPAGYTVTPSRRLAGTFSPIVTDASQRTFLSLARAALTLSALPDGLSLRGTGEGRALMEGSATRLIAPLSP